MNFIFKNKLKFKGNYKCLINFGNPQPGDVVPYLITQDCSQQKKIMSNEIGVELFTGPNCNTRSYFKVQYNSDLYIQKISTYIVGQILVTNLDKLAVTPYVTLNGNQINLPNVFQSYLQFLNLMLYNQYNQTMVVNSQQLDFSFTPSVSSSPLYPYGQIGMLMILQFCPDNCKQCDDTSCQACIDGYYLGDSNTCVQCNQSCSTCDQNGCTACKQSSYFISVQNNNLCISDCDLSQGFYEYSNAGSNVKYCKKCNSLCQTCTDDSTNCACKIFSSQNQCVSICQASEVLLPNNVGQQKCYSCDNSCLTCNGIGKTQCIYCNINYLRQTQTSLCVQTCATNEFKNDQLKQCVPCNENCLTCDGPNSNNCLSCKPGTFFFNSQCVQVCPNGYKINIQTQSCDLCTSYKDQTCYSCFKSCFECTLQFQFINKCTSCYSQTRQLDSNNDCKCLNPYDQRNIFYHCSYQNIAVLELYLSGTDPLLTINFGSPIQITDTTIITPSAICQYVFSQNTVNIIGSNSNCSIEGNLLNVLLDEQSTVMENDIIELLPGKLQFSNHNSPITQIYGDQVKQNPYGKSKVLFSYQTTQNTCDPVIVTLDKIQGDARRGFLSFIWSLEYSQGSLSDSQLQEINQVIDEANQLKSTSLNFSPGVFPSNYNIVIKFSYNLKVNNSDFETIQILYKKQKIIRISYILSDYPPIYRYMDLIFKFSFFNEICDQKQATRIYEPVNLQVISPNLSLIEQNIQDYQYTIYELQIHPYSLPSGQNFEYQLALSLVSDTSIKTIQKVSVDVLITDLFVLISGGTDHIVSYQKQFSLASQSRDYEIQDETADQMINYQWDCQDLGGSKCKDYNDNEIQLQQGISSISIPAGTFKPYSIIQLILEVSKDNRKSSDNAFCYFSELDIPSLFVITPIKQLNQKFNINEDLEFQLIYDAQVSSDLLSYAGALLYKNNVVGAIKFDYYKVKFRIWDYYSEIDPAQSKLQVRFSVYNPMYVMPSISTIDLQINVPPQNCVLKLDPQQGAALETIFTIEFSNCQDTDSPLTFQFFYYNQDGDFKKEKTEPWNIVRRQLNDRSSNNTIQTFLPQGNLVILSQAIDSKLGVSNSTLSVQISPQNLTDSDYFLKANQFIEKSMQNYQITQKLTGLCIIGEDVSKYTSFDESEKIKSLKQNLITNILEVSQQLPNSSLMPTYANKIISELQQSQTKQTDQQKATLYDKVESIIIKTQANIQSNSINQLQKNNDLNTQNLVDSFKILNQTVSLKTINSFNDYMKYDNLTNLIGNLLSASLIPNQGDIILKGNLSSLLSDQITEKNIKLYALPYDTTEQSQDKLHTYVVTKNTYEENIYQNTSSFQAYIEKLNEVTQNFNYSQNQVIKMSINNTMTKSPLANSTIMYQFTNVQNNTKYNMTCLQQGDQIWSKKDCSLVSQNGQSQACFCKKQAPTTVVEDIADMLLNNKNLQTAFGEQGLENLSNFTKFYQYISFWTLTVFTLNQIILSLVGRNLDLKTVQKINLKNSQEEQKNILQQYQNQIKNLEEKIQVQQSKDSFSRIKSTQKILINSKQKQNLEQTPLQTSPFQNPTYPIIQISNSNQEDDFNMQQQDIQELVIQESNSVVKSNMLQLKQLGEKNKQLQVQYTNKNKDLDDQENQFSSKFEDDNKEQKNQPETACQINDIQNQESNLSEQQQNNYMQISLTKKIIIFHQLVGIFYIYDNILSRPTRFTLFYVKIIHQLAISIIFGQYRKIEQQIVVAIINAILIEFFSFLIQFVYKKGKLGKRFSVIFQILIVLFYYYIILSISSGQSPGESNKFFLAFFLSVALNLIVVQIIMSFLMMQVSLQYLKNQKTKIILKLFNIFSLKQIIQNLDL